MRKLISEEEKKEKKIEEKEVENVPLKKSVEIKDAKNLRRMNMKDTEVGWMITIIIVVVVAFFFLGKGCSKSIKVADAKVSATVVTPVAKKHVVKHVSETTKVVFKQQIVVAVNTPVATQEGNTAYIKNMSSDYVDMFITQNSEINGPVIFKVGAPVPSGVTHTFHFANKENRMHVVIFVRLSDGTVKGYTCVFDDDTREVAFQVKG